MTDTDQLRSGPGSLPFLAGGGEMGERTRAFEWSATPLGPPKSWPQGLQAAVSICLNSRFPIVLWWGPELRLIYNDAWRPVLGQTKHPQALGSPGREVWPEIWHIIGPMLEGVLTQGKATWSDDQLLPLDRNGYLEEAYFTYSYSPILDDGGKVGGVFAAVNETTQRVISERRLKTLRGLAAQAALAKSADEACRAIVATLATNPSDVPCALLYLLDDDQKQARLCEATGLPPTHPARPHVVRLDGDEAHCAWPLASVVQSGRMLVDLDAGHGEIPTSSWPVPPRQAILLPLMSSSQDRTVGVLILGVHPGRELDDEHRGFHDLVAGHVATAIANARAYEEERRRAEALAELDRAKTAFFSNVSHEFRTPLALMLGPVEDMLAKPTEQVLPENRQLLEVVHRNGLRLQRLVNTLLDFSRIEAGRVRATYEPTDLAALTADLASNFRSACEKAGLELEVDCPPLAEPVFVDRQMWEKVVLNLLSNAFKFTFEGQIGVSVRQVERTAQLQVWDTGTGIPAEEMPRLFERFHRVENARGRTHEGSGIGLALVQELVKLHGGSILAESKVGRGTTFFVSIPLGSTHLPRERIGHGRSLASTAIGASPFMEEALRCLPDQPDRQEAGTGIPAYEEPVPAPAPVAPDGDRPRVLVADDNADMRQYIVRLLAGQYTVEAVPDGEAALAVIRRQTPDLILTDVMMPRLDGFELLRQLRGNPATATVPVILLSARAGEESRVEGVEAGADDYLVKPFSARELLARVTAQVQMARLRREAGEALRQSEEHLRAVVETTPACIKVVAADGTLLSMNSAGLGMVDAQHPEDVQGGCVYNLICAECRDAYREFNERVCRGEAGTLEFEIEGLRGTRRYMETHAAPLRGPDGSFRQLAITYDITERKRAEAALRQSEQALKDADRRKDEFLATLAHELRNPLAPLRNGLQVMKLARGNAGAAEQSRAMMERQLAQMVRLIDDLLDVSRISRGKLTLQRQRVELAAVVQQAVETSRPLIEANEHHLAITVPSDPIYVDADVTRLAQVFSNLLNNAAKYTKPGGRIMLHLERQGSDAVVLVRDSGVGIPQHMLPKLFEMFTQVERSLERSQGGLGIGLSLVKRLTEMHGGSVEAKSDGPGMGSEFVVRLPVVLSVAVEKHNEAGEEKIEQTTRRRILVVDDNQDSAMSLAMMLKLMGNEVRTDHDGLEGVAAAAAFRPDMILLDIGMPKLNGYDACRRIREQPWAKNTVIIAMTGWGQEEDKRRSQEAGFNSHLVKPIEPAALEKLLADLQAQPA